MIRLLKSLMVAAVISMVFPVVGHCNQVVNGDFSAGTANWAFTGNVQVADSTAYVGCCASGDTGTGNFAAFGGGDGPDNGQVSQTFATVAGQEYSLTFLYGAFSSPSGVGTQSVTISSGDLNTTLTSPTSVRELGDVFSSYQYNFVAGGATTTLTFADVSTNTSSIDAFLDNVDVESVSAVPEPSSLGLVGIGFTCLSAFYRNRIRR
jgi:hypothetical protein